MLSLNTYIILKKQCFCSQRNIRKMRCYHYYSDTSSSLCTYTALCTLFCVGSCYSRTASFHKDDSKRISTARCTPKCACTISKGEISMDCFRATGKYNFNDILMQGIDRKDQDQETLCLETRAARKTYRDHTWPRARRDSDGESFSVIEHRPRP